MNKHRIQPLRDFCEIPPRLFLGEELLNPDLKKLLSLLKERWVKRAVANFGRKG